MKNRITDDDVLLTTQMTAKIYGVTPRTVQNWVKAGCPKLESGGFSMRAVARWMREGMPVERTDIDELPLSQQKLYYESRHKAALTEIQKLKLEGMRGEVVPVDEVRRELTRFMQIFRREAYAMGRTVVEEASGDMPTEKIRALDAKIYDAVTEVLRQMSVGNFRWEEDEGSGEK